MTDHDLATLLREHVQEQEPPFALSADTSIARGRRTLLRRRARRGFAGVLVAAAAVAAIPLLPWGGSGGPADDRTGIDPATAYALEHYDATAMPRIIDEHARAALGDSLSGLGPAKFTAGDDQGVSLPPEHYDKASSMEVAYGGEGDRRVRVTLLHSRSEAEGDARKNCASDLDAGYYFSCDVTTAPNGDTITTSVMAVRPLDRPDSGWGALTREELRTGNPVPGDPSQGPIDPDQVYFIRNVESVHSETFLTSVQEVVKAPTLAKAAFAVSPDLMATLVTDPSLVIPKPPIGDNGCAWMLHPEGTSCSKNPS
jgi:hypothetical protein